ncbi:hypothetical protein [Streptomyces sp. NPDC006638]|uniref:hypothetical protein n=1 Tax=Streptomyces sp. NPDC006638 TaxID=3157183 RepID=UPI0033BC4DAC
MSAPQNAASAPGLTAPGRPVRDPDPVRNAAYWARIDRLVAAAPPLSNAQRAAIRTAFHQPGDRKEMAA